MKDKKAYVRLSVVLQELDVVCTSGAGGVQTEDDVYGNDRLDWFMS